MRHSIYFPAFLLLLFLSACGEKQQQAAPTGPQPVKVVLDAVVSGDPVYYEEYPATLAPLNQVDLRPQVSGFITGIHFEDGSRVRKGQLLYSIDAQLYTANYQQAVASLKSQEANLVKAQKDADRYRELEKNDAVARQLVDNAEAALEVAKKQVESAKAAISASETSVRYTKILAPFDGLIGISQVKVGSPVSQGQTLLNTVSTDKEMAVDFNIDQRNIYRYSKLMQSKNTDSTFRLAFGREMYPVPGRLALLDRSVDPQTGSIKARVIIKNQDDVLRAGMNATVRIRNATQQNALLIPYKAVTEQLGEYFVYVKGDSNKVSQVNVHLGTQIGSDIIITEGLSVNDSVVVEGIQNLREGAVIESVPPSRPTGQQKN